MPARGEPGRRYSLVKDGPSKINALPP
jgi:hypothetical protein